MGVLWEKEFFEFNAGSNPAISTNLLKYEKSKNRSKNKKSASYYQSD